MKRLKLEDISNPPALKEQEVELEQWNKTVIVQGLTKADTVEINELSEDELKDSFGTFRPVQSLNPYMTKLSLCSIEKDGLVESILMITSFYEMFAHMI